MKKNDGAHLDGLKKFMPPAAGGGTPPMPSGVKPPPGGGMNKFASTEKDEDDSDEGIAEKLFGKALNSKSMHVLAPIGQYDPFNVQRSASTIPVTRAAVTETNPHIYRPEQIYKSCMTHGITYRAESGCQPCNVYKSSTCSKCGDTMNKKAGGMLACSHGH
jgi:hypothetical protein